MRNGYKIIWSERAINDLNLIVQYLNESWSEKEIKKFLANINQSLFHLQVFPEAFPSTPQKKNLRRYVISKRHTLYYLFEDNNIYLISIFDNRQKEFRL